MLIVTCGGQSRYQQCAKSAVEFCLSDALVRQEKTVKRAFNPKCFFPTGAGSITIAFKTAFVLHRVKTYLRSTMPQMRLNNIIILHALKERADALPIASCL